MWTTLTPFFRGVEQEREKGRPVQTPTFLLVPSLRFLPFLDFLDFPLPSGLRVLFIGHWVLLVFLPIIFSRELHMGLHRTRMEHGWERAFSMERFVWLYF